MSKKRIIPAAVAFALTFAYGAYAREATISIKLTDNSVTASGSFEQEASKPYVSKIYPSGSVLSDDAAIEAGIAAVGQSVSGSDGSFESKLILSDELASGEYVFEVASSGTREILKASFEFFSAQDRETIVDRFNEAETAGELEALVTTYKSLIGIDFGGSYAQLADKDGVYEKLLKMIPFEDMTGINQGFEEVCLVSLFKTYDAGKALELMSKNPALMQMSEDTEAVYDKIKSDELKIAEKLTGKDYDSYDDFSKALDEAIAMVAFATLDRTDMADLIETYKSNLDLRDFEELSGSDKNQVYKKLEAKSDFDDFDNISNCIKDAINSLDSGGGGGGGGSSSVGKSSASSVAVPGLSAPVQVPESDVRMTHPFVDMNSASWAEEAVWYLYNAGHVSGVDLVHFEPLRSITREEFVKMVVCAFDIHGEAQLSFSDVPSGSWYAEYVERAAAAGIINGVSETEFGSGQTLTRQDMVVILKRAADFKGIRLSSFASVTFTDEGSISDYAKASVSSLASAQIINGMGDGSFAPLADANRAMVAKVVYTLLPEKGA